MSDTESCIAKNGVVDRVDDQKVYVRILSVSACASCHAKGVCTSLETSEKLIEIDKKDASSVSLGQNVKVSMSSVNGNLAVVYGYVLPFIILLIVLIILANFISEGYAGLIAILSLIPYYFGLYLFRDRLKERFRFSIE